MSAPSDLRAQLEAVLAPTPTEWGTSRYHEFERCPRAHHLRYHQGIHTRTTASYFRVGQLFHACLAHSAQGGQWGDVLEFAATEQAAPLDQCAEVERLLTAYFAHYGHHASAGFDPMRWEIIDVEVPFQGAIGGLQRTARADLVVRVGGRLVVVDHKTRSQKVPDDVQEYERTLRTRPQLLTLSWLAWRHYQVGEPPSVMLNEVVKTKVPKFGRTLARITLEDVTRWRKNEEQRGHDERVYLLGKDDHLATPLRPAPMRYDACAPQIGSRCQYFQWCHGSADEQELHYSTPAQREAAKGSEHE